MANGGDGGNGGRLLGGVALGLGAAAVLTGRRGRPVLALALGAAAIAVGAVARGRVHDRPPSADIDLEDPAGRRGVDLTEPIADPLSLD